jgi:hypothetical protein
MGPLKSLMQNLEQLLKGRENHLSVHEELMVELRNSIQST